jgi:hypothetical protein
MKGSAYTFLLIVAVGFTNVAMNRGVADVTRRERFSRRKGCGKRQGSKESKPKRFRLEVDVFAFAMTPVSFQQSNGAVDERASREFLRSTRKILPASDTAH